MPANQPRQSAISHHVPANMAPTENNNDKKQLVPIMTLEEDLKVCVGVMASFFRNQFDKAFEDCVEHCDKLLYHAIGTCYHSFIYAVFTMEKDQIERSTICCAKALKVISPMRKQKSIISGWFSKVDYNDYTDMEAHAEVSHGEIMFMQMMLQFLGDQSLLSLVKGAAKFLSCNSSLKLCNEIMNNKTNWTSDFLGRDFECGVRMSFGFINLIFSHLPNRLMRLISIVGIHADQELGLAYLHKATDELDDCSKSPIVRLLVCFYSFYMEQFFGAGEADLEWVKRITDKGLADFPDGAFDLFWSGRAHQLTGQPEKAVELFKRCISVQDEFKQMHNVCRWDMLWSYAIQCDWNNAAICAKQLQESCNWSKATNAYQYACFQYMIMTEENRPELRKEVDAAMLTIVDLRRKIAGKTLPPEKFAIIMADRYNKGETDLVLPALVLFYIWNIYGNAAGKEGTLQPILDRINKKIKEVQGDSYYLLLLLKGVCLRNMKRSDEALKCFTEIFENEGDIRKENYVPPHAAFEMGMTYKDLEKYDDAKSWLEKARDKYSGFLVEAVVQLRIHGALANMKAALKKM